ncbi:MAG: DoxX family protein [Micromonosporaceae bacterium]
MDIIALIGRILFALIFIASGFSHLAQSAAMTGYAESKKVPAAKLAVPASGVMIIVGGLMVLLGLWGDLGALLLVAFLLPTAALMHGFWGVSDPQERQGEMIHFLKDTALAGAALLVFVLYATADVGLTITDPLF